MRVGIVGLGYVGLPLAVAFAGAGVDVMFHVTLFDASVRQGRLASVRLAHNGGPMEVQAKVFVDATGDALLAALCGCESMVGDEKGQVIDVASAAMYEGRVEQPIAIGKTRVPR